MSLGFGVEIFTRGNSIEVMSNRGPCRSAAKSPRPVLNLRTGGKGKARQAIVSIDGGKRERSSMI